MKANYVQNAAFSGLLFSGKDHVAKASKFNIIGFADPLYDLVEFIYGSQDKSIPEVRSAMQNIGQWGWGYYDPEAPIESPYHRYNQHRLAITALIRTQGEKMAPKWKVDWLKFGHVRTFWVDILLARLPKAKATPFQAVQRPMFQQFPEPRMAVTNVRFNHEFDPIEKANLPHFLVLCSEETRMERIQAAGKSMTPEQLHDKSEMLAWDLRERALNGDASFPSSRVIWNDHRPMPEGREFIKAEDWIAAQTVETGVTSDSL